MAFGEALVEAYVPAPLSYAIRRYKDGFALTLIFSEAPCLEALGDFAKTQGFAKYWRPEAIALEDIPDRDWLAWSYQQFPPFAVGRFFIYGQHYKDDIPAGQTGLQIDAATAFGSGEHGTTAGCLTLMQDLCDSGAAPARILDLGCGSGILAIAAAKLWLDATVSGSDIDAEAVRVSALHAAANQEDDIDFLTAEGLNDACLSARAPYDLLIANILAGPLKEMAADLCAATAAGGRIILSGILDEQAEEVQAVYEAHGWAPVQTHHDRGWTSFLLRCL